MVGKAKRPRLHRAAPRPARDPPPPLPGPGLGPAAGGWSAAAGKDWDLSSGVFSGLKIDPDTLVQKLDLDSRSIISSRTEIESVKMAKKKQKAEAKRKATPVVGDMQPLLEALPELSYLTTGGRARKPLKRLVPFGDGLCVCLLPAGWRGLQLSLEEEVARFQEVISDPQYRANPLVAISKHLSERLGQGEAGQAL
uniref:F207A protein n=1 Tax=Junco hyemalis TaxID=40217 RepID=A0A8C5INK5_JUNHY